MEYQADCIHHLVIMVTRSHTHLPYTTMYKPIEHMNKQCITLHMIGHTHPHTHTSLMIRLCTRVLQEFIIHNRPIKCQIHSSHRRAILTYLLLELSQIALSLRKCPISPWWPHPLNMPLLMLTRADDLVIVKPLLKEKSTHLKLLIALFQTYMTIHPPHPHRNHPQNYSSRPHHHKSPPFPHRSCPYHHKIRPHHHKIRSYLLRGHTHPHNNRPHLHRSP